MVHHTFNTWNNGEQAKMSTRPLEAGNQSAHSEDYTSSLYDAVGANDLSIDHGDSGLGDMASYINLDLDVKTEGQEEPPQSEPSERPEGFSFLERYWESQGFQFDPNLPLDAYSFGPDAGGDISGMNPPSSDLQLDLGIPSGGDGAELQREATDPDLSHDQAKECDMAFSDILGDLSLPSVSPNFENDYSFHSDVAGNSLDLGDMGTFLQNPVTAVNADNSEPQGVSGMVQALASPTTPFTFQFPLVPEPLTPQSAPTPGSANPRKRLASVTPPDRPEPKRRAPVRTKKDGKYAAFEANKLLDSTAIYRLLSTPTKPGRKVAVWVQRHPYGSSKHYKDISTTWCHYSGCKGIDTNSTIMKDGELVKKNYKFPRTMISGNYQVAIDSGYVDKERIAFAGDNGEEVKEEYKNRNVMNSNDACFHLECFEKAIDFLALIRGSMNNVVVMIDHRVLKKPENVVDWGARRPPKGGPNPAEIEWYLKSPTEEWMENVKKDASFEPEPLAKLLLRRKVEHNDKKGQALLSEPLRQIIAIADRSDSAPVLSETNRNVNYQDPAPEEGEEPYDLTKKFPPKSPSRPSEGNTPPMYKYKHMSMGPFYQD